MKFSINIQVTKGQILGVLALLTMSGCGIIASLTPPSDTTPTLPPETPAQKSERIDKAAKALVAEMKAEREKNKSSITEVQANSFDIVSVENVISYADLMAEKSSNERALMLHQAVKCYVPNFDSVDSDNSSGVKFLTLALAAKSEQITDSGASRYFTAKNVIRYQPEIARNAYQAYHSIMCDGMPMDNN